ncbi:hypothetical protein B0H19DRAFT_1272845 [Mycena capillaripes]|nr:hypothetical protein B0H19DRAFT_1272845 [Mycena capillaripes]
MPVQKKRLRTAAGPRIAHRASRAPVRAATTDCLNPTASVAAPRRHRPSLRTAPPTHSSPEPTHSVGERGAHPIFQSRQGEPNEMLDDFVSRAWLHRCSGGVQLDAPAEFVLPYPGSRSADYTGCAELACTFRGAQAVVQIRPLAQGMDANTIRTECSHTAWRIHGHDASALAPCRLARAGRISGGALPYLAGGFFCRALSSSSCTRACQSSLRQNGSESASFAAPPRVHLKAPPELVFPLHRVAYRRPCRFRTPTMERVDMQCSAARRRRYEHGRSRWVKTPE